MLIRDEYFALLKNWCDSLIKMQITELKSVGLFGGVACPACSAIHGRCYDAVHPLLYMASISSRAIYIRSAERLIDWSDHLQCSDGSFSNDTTNDWKGITVFSSIGLTKALYMYGHLLSTKKREKLADKVNGCLEYLHNTFDPTEGNINYLIACACALQLGGQYQNNHAYKLKAHEYAERFLDHLSVNKLITGEGGAHWEQRTPKGCSPIDIGYNVEESLNLLAIYASSSNDSKLFEVARSIADSHLSFFLPDGGWDNSFGSRMDKWTYWGSRTADGCQTAYTILGDKPSFLWAAYKNFTLLRECTIDGILYGGRDLCLHDHPPCIHHTFAHANGLVTAIEYLDKNALQIPEQPHQECFDSYYDELDTYLYQSHSFRATITGYDLAEKPNCHPTGGALSLLYSMKAGIILASSMTKYQRFEGINLQRHIDCLDHPLTLRVQCISRGVIYSNILDSAAVITHPSRDEYVIYGKISDNCGNSLGECTTHYLFGDSTITIRFNCDTDRELDIYIPIISAKTERFMPTDRGYAVEKGQCLVRLTSNEHISLYNNGERIFNLVPGFEALPFVIRNASEDAWIRIDTQPMRKEGTDEV